MGWKALNDEQKKRVRGFMSFTEGSRVVGMLDSAHIKPDNSGYFVLRLTEASKIAVKDDSAPSGLAMAASGELVGVRKTGATKRLRDLPLGTLVSLTYVGFQERTALNPKTQLMETNPYHYIDIDVYTEDTENTEVA